MVAIAVFARAPVAGYAKTRLIPRLGAEGAAALQSGLIQHTVATAIASGVGPVSLWCTPDEHDACFLACHARWGVELRRQSDGDLGVRMHATLTNLCTNAARHQKGALLIGTDCPALTTRHLVDATQTLLDGNDAVFLPAEDGGYVLVGLRHPEPCLFSDMPWGDHMVMSLTRQRLCALGWHWKEPEILWDIDRPDDVDRLRDSGLLQTYG